MCTVQDAKWRRVPAASARRGRDVMVAGDAARAHSRARAPLAHAARAHQHRAQATLLLHAQEEVSPHALFHLLTVAWHAACL